MTTGSVPFAVPPSVIAARVAAIHVFVSERLQAVAWILATSARMTTGSNPFAVPTSVIAARSTTRSPEQRCGERLQLTRR
jgi:hypothetical protein